MSTRGSKRLLKGYSRDARRRKMVLDVDLNVDPPAEGRVPQAVASSHGDPQDTQVGGVGGASASAEGGLHNVPIDVEAIDDDVVISSPRRFTEARNHSRRNQVVTVVLDEDSDVQRGLSGSVVEEPATRLTLNSYNSHSRNSTNETIINCELYINLESNRIARGRNTVNLNSEQHMASDAVNPIPISELQTVAPPKEEPTFSCAVCMGPLVEATSTICGHIFCKACIKAAIAAQKKCPTCRRKLTASNIHRIYLPTIN